MFYAYTEEYYIDWELPMDHLKHKDAGWLQANAMVQYCVVVCPSLTSHQCVFKFPISLQTQCTLTRCMLSLGMLSFYVF